MAGINLQLEPEALRPLVEAVVAEALARLETERAKVSGSKLAYTEAEAARLIGLNPHQLRDERLRGRIAASRIVGDGIRYLHADLIAYLMRKREGEGAGGNGVADRKAKGKR